MPVKPIPDGYHTITPYLVVTGAEKVLNFLTKAFQAQVIHRITSPEGLVKHAELKIGDSMVMLGEGRPPEHPARTAMLYLYVTNTDEVYQRAIAAGGISLLEPTDQYYGDRNAGVEDPAGNQWWIATHVKDLSDAEIANLASQHA